VAEIRWGLLGRVFTPLSPFVGVAENRRGLLGREFTPLAGCKAEAPLFLLESVNGAAAAANDDASSLLFPLVAMASAAFTGVGFVVGFVAGVVLLLPPVVLPDAWLLVVSDASCLSSDAWFLVVSDAWFLVAVFANPRGLAVRGGGATTRRPLPPDTTAADPLVDPLAAD
jgi:hypothetical protein